MRLIIRVLALCLALATCACTPTSRSSTASSAARSVSPSTHSSLTAKPGSKRVSLGHATVVIPKRWFSADFHGLPSPLASPIVFYSSSPFVTRCARPAQHVCRTSTWFPADVPTPPDGLLVNWVDDEAPGPDIAWQALPGRPTKIHHHVAKVYTGVNDGDCPVVTARELAAYIHVDTKPTLIGKKREYTGSRLEMTACFGPHVSAADRLAVWRMLHSLRIFPRHWVR